MPCALHQARKAGGGRCSSETSLVRTSVVVEGHPNAAAREFVAVVIGP